MVFPERFSQLPDYAFPRLRKLLDGVSPGGVAADRGPIRMSIGEPRHLMPDFVGPIIAAHVGEFGRYPPNEGSAVLLDAVAGWIRRRHGVRVAPDRLMALNGSREGLFNACIALCPEEKRGRPPIVLIPNPFYQVYAVAALAAGAVPVYVPAPPETGFLPDFAALPPEILDRAAILYICSPSNPQGAVAPRGYLADLVTLAERHDFRILADECYSELWRDAPPPGLLEVATNADPERITVFNSLSKRSNMPGLRSGFVCGGRESIRRLRRLRTYAGAPLPLPLQRVAEAAWRDEAHVEVSRALYQEKYALAARILGDVPGFSAPDGGMFLWLRVGDGEEAALRLWREAGVMVLPGAYLARDVDGVNPGRDYIRVALVAPVEETRDGLMRLRSCIWNKG